MLQVKNQILNFLLLEFKIPLDLSLSIGHKNNKFFEALLEKSLKFVLNRKNGTVASNFGLVLLPTKIDLIPEK